MTCCCIIGGCCWWVGGPGAGLDGDSGCSSLAVLDVVPDKTGGPIVGLPWWDDGLPLATFPLGIGVMLKPLKCPSNPAWSPSLGRRLALEWSTASGPDISTAVLVRWPPPIPDFFSWWLFKE